ncbi:thioredoxin [Archaeoglobus veneficus]|uniref:Thioredoxin n=1 Tax=Archaeoglobus veneficus (strain DSM 11195 / SNP6) TaxID=693661 RepID=F2KNK8_ARCVS|nr:thioredoxin [Archaeoglobus veneficus]AEA46236.1 thioredoxin [Archaeoglobus veneficus SNP6]
MKEVNGNFKEIVNKDTLVVVDFYADWCGPCRFLTPVLEKLEKEFDGVEFVKVNVDRHRELAFEFGISSIPTVLMFHKGKIVNSFIGALPEAAVRVEIERALQLIQP